MIFYAMSSRVYVLVSLSGPVGRTLACMRQVQAVSLHILLPMQLLGTHYHPIRPHQFPTINLPPLRNRTRVRAPHITLSILPLLHRMEAAAERLAQNQKHHRPSSSGHLYCGPRPTFIYSLFQLVDRLSYLQVWIPFAASCILSGPPRVVRVRDHYPIFTYHLMNSTGFAELFCIPFPPRMPNLCIINSWTSCLLFFCLGYL